MDSVATLKDESQPRMIEKLELVEQLHYIQVAALKKKIAKLRRELKSKTLMATSYHRQSRQSNAKIILLNQKVRRLRKIQKQLEGEKEKSHELQQDLRDQQRTLRIWKNRCHQLEKLMTKYEDYIEHLELDLPARNISRAHITRLAALKDGLINSMANLQQVEDGLLTSSEHTCDLRWKHQMSLLAQWLTVEAPLTQVPIQMPEDSTEDFVSINLSLGRWVAAIRGLQEKQNQRALQIEELRLNNDHILGMLDGCRGPSPHQEWQDAAVQTVKDSQSVELVKLRLNKANSVIGLIAGISANLMLYLAQHPSKVYIRHLERAYTIRSIPKKGRSFARYALAVVFVCLLNNRSLRRRSKAKASSRLMCLINRYSPQKVYEYQTSPLNNDEGLLMSEEQLCFRAIKFHMQRQQTSNIAIN